MLPSELSFDNVICLFAIYCVLIRVGKTNVEVERNILHIIYQKATIARAK